MNKNIIVLALMSLVACSSKTGTNHQEPVSSLPNSMTDPPPATDQPPPDNTSSSSSSGNPVTDAGTTVHDQASCVAACEDQYPQAAVLSHQLDKSCFTGGNCEPVCDNLQGSGKEFGPGTLDPDAGFVCNTAMANSWAISTPSQMCSSCIATDQTCCNLWIKIYGSQDGQSLSNCAVSCYQKYPN